MDGEQSKTTALQEEKSVNGNDASFEYDSIKERKLIRKIDWRLLPILGALYSISLIDRTNVGSLFPINLDLHDIF
jgi:hypothetical protein